MHEMTALEKAESLFAVVLPFAGTVLAIVLLWGDLVRPADLIILLVLYVVSELGVNVGYHRLLTHRSFQTSKRGEYAFAVLGTMSMQGPVIGWVADHRKHHSHTDKPGDPHSPHVRQDGSKPKTALGGLWHAHTGWLFSDLNVADWDRYAPELNEDRGMRIISRLFIPILLVGGILVPGILGWLVTGTMAGALSAALWGGLVRIFLGHHMTWSVNSICHFFGSRRFETDDRSTNIALLALPSLGESWHHNHHAFPRSAAHGLKRWEIDLGAFVITTLEKLGLAWNVIRISPERQAERELDT